MVFLLNDFTGAFLQRTVGARELRALPAVAGTRRPDVAPGGKARVREHHDGPLRHGRGDQALTRGPDRSPIAPRGDPIEMLHPAGMMEEIAHAVEALTHRMDARHGLTGPLPGRRDA